MRRKQLKAEYAIKKVVFEDHFETHQSETVDGYIILYMISFDFLV